MGNDYAGQCGSRLQTFDRWEILVAFEVFDKRMTPLAKAPSVTIHKRGVISLNKAAHDLLGGAETVELLYDQDRQVMALRPADDSSPHA
ncbi:UNVERIFIED_CONTAM: hypothetical protein QYM44_16935 [Kocuria sp. CPCC 205315]